MHEISQVHTFSKRLPFFFAPSASLLLNHGWVFNLDRKEEGEDKSGVGVLCQPNALVVNTGNTQHEVDSSWRFSML